MASWMTLGRAAAGDYPVLAAWASELLRTARTVEHPFNAGLMLEALVSQARSALNSAVQTRTR